jgi:hypothetical protein
VSGPETTKPNTLPEHGLTSGSHPFDLECAFVDDNVEAFVLRTLDLSDQQRVALHLRWCQRCRAVAGAYAEIPRLLPFSVPLVDGPSPDIKTRLMARIAHDADAEAVAPPALVEATKPKTRGSRLTAWQRRFMPTAAVLLTAALLFVSAWGIGLQNEIESLRAETNLPTNFTGQPVASPRLFTTKPACPNCTGLAQLGADPGKTTAVLMAWGLDPNQTHEVWCMHENGETSRVAILDVNESGDAMQTLTFTQPIAGYLEIRIVKQNDASPELIFSVKHDMEEATNTDQLISDYSA